MREEYGMDGLLCMRPCHNQIPLKIIQITMMINDEDKVIFLKPAKPNRRNGEIEKRNIMIKCTIVRREIDSCIMERLAAMAKG